MARNKALKNFIVVAEIKTGTIKKIVEVLKKEGVRGIRSKDIDCALIQKAEELGREFPPTIYDTVITLSADFVVLQKGYPEFSGWEKVNIEKISVE